jgi:ankyrin repeat protein
LSNVDGINHVDKLASQTALYYAAKKGNTEFCRRLIEKGANPAHLDAQNKTAADYAKKSRHNETADLLNQEIRRQKEVLMPQSMEMSAQREESQQTNQQRKKKDVPSIAPSVPRATYKIVFMNEKG